MWVTGHRLAESIFEAFVREIVLPCILKRFMAKHLLEQGSLISPISDGAFADTFAKLVIAFMRYVFATTHEAHQRGDVIFCEYLP